MPQSPIDQESEDNREALLIATAMRKTLAEWAASGTQAGILLMAAEMSVRNLIESISDQQRICPYRASMVWIAGFTNNTLAT